MNYTTFLAIAFLSMSAFAQSENPVPQPAEPLPSTPVAVAPKGISFGPKLTESEAKEIAKDAIERAGDRLRVIAADFESNALSENEAPTAPLVMMAARLRSIADLTTSEGVYFDSGCIPGVKGCVTWAPFGEKIRVRVGLDSQAFIYWSDFEWTELIAHELSHALDILESAKAARSLKIYDTEREAFRLSVFLFSHAGEDIPRVCGVTIDSRRNVRSLLKRVDILEKQITKALKGCGQFYGANDFAYLPSTIAIR